MYTYQMDKLVEAGQWWLLLIPLGTGVCALLGSWLGASLARHSERKQWTRNRKQEAYALFIGRAGFTANDALLMLDPDKFLELLAREAERLQAYWQLEIVASNAVSREAKRLVNAMKRFRQVVVEMNNGEAQGAERLVNPLSTDSEAVLALLKSLVAQYQGQKHNDMVGALTDGIHSVTFELIRTMRKDLGLPTFNPSTEEEEDVFNEALESIRRLWGAYGIDSKRAGSIAFEDLDIMGPKAHEQVVKS